MKYIIHSLLRWPVEKYQHNLVTEIYKKFGINITKEENFNTHFTLKYRFETDHIEEIEKIISDFCDKNKKTPVCVGWFGNFSSEVVFINVNLSYEAKSIFSEFISELKKVSWMPWDKYDDENLHFYSTIAEECNEKFVDIQDFITGKEKYFDCWFDNITILELFEKKDQIKEWKIWKSFSMK